MSDDFLNKILQTPTAFIIGEEEILNRTSLNFIFKASIKTNIHKYYFINVNDYLSEFLAKNVETKDYSILSDLPDFKEVSDYNLIISGVKPTSNQLLRITQKSRNKIAIFLVIKLGC